MAETHIEAITGEKVCMVPPNTDLVNVETINAAKVVRCAEGTDDEPPTKKIKLKGTTYNLGSDLKDETGTDVTAGEKAGTNELPTAKLMGGDSMATTDESSSTHIDDATSGPADKDLVTDTANGDMEVVVATKMASERLANRMDAGEADPPTVTATVHRRGGASRVSRNIIKEQYIDNAHCMRAADHLPKSALEQIKTINAAKVAQDAAGTDDTSKKKYKLKGRHGKRPLEKKPEGMARLCPAVVNERPCEYDDRGKCRYNHSAVDFLRVKPDDIGPTCYVYETYGKCPYSVTCRFAASHITDEGANRVNADLWEAGGGGERKAGSVRNILTKPLRKALWKKRYVFGRAMDVVSAIRKGDTARLHEMADRGADTDPDPAKDGDNGTTEKDAHQTVKPGTDADSSDLMAVRPSAAGTNESVADSVAQTQATGVRANVGADGASPTATDQTCTGATRASSTDYHPITKETKTIDFRDKLYLAPLTTVGNLPFRRICKRYGVDITCGEMVLPISILQGQSSEWALVKRHESEDLFGVQLCASFPETMSRCTKLLVDNIDVDFMDVNCGCPIDFIYRKGEGCGMMSRPLKLQQIVLGMRAVMPRRLPLTIKMRTGIHDDTKLAHKLLPTLRDHGVSLITIHGRSRQQRYTRLADWNYIDECSKLAAGTIPIFGNGDILSYTDYITRRGQTGVSGCMVARGALIKPWIFTEIKEERHWDISSGERLDMLRDFVNFGLEQWGSDQQGIMSTRRFLLEWLSFLHRYIPVGLLEQPPQHIHEKPPFYIGRDDLETLMASSNCADWIKITEMLLGPVPDDFKFLPKHKANAYQ